MLYTSLLRLVNIGLCHREICVGPDENNTDYFFGGKYPLVCILLGKPLSYFLSLTEKALLIVCRISHHYYNDTNRFIHPTLPNRSWVRHDYLYIVWQSHRQWTSQEFAVTRVGLSLTGTVTYPTIRCRILTPPSDSYADPNVREV